MQAQKNPAKEILTDALGAPEGAVSYAWDVVQRHPLATLGAVAAGVGAYVLLRHIEKDKPASSRSSAPAAKRGRRRSSRPSRRVRPAQAASARAASARA
jgi:hypothetical protein